MHQFFLDQPSKRFCQSHFFRLVSGVLFSASGQCWLIDRVRPRQADPMLATNLLCLMPIPHQLSHIADFKCIVSGVADGLLIFLGLTLGNVPYVPMP